VQVCTAVMHYGFRIVEHMIDGLAGWMRQKGFKTVNDFVGKSAARIGDWSALDLNYKVVAEIDQAKCINCGLCYIACEDGCHQSINIERLTEKEFAKLQKRVGSAMRTKSGGGENGPHGGPYERANGHGPRTFESGNKTYTYGAGDGYVNLYTINEDTCVGCNMCSLVCPVDDCIDLKEIDTGKPPMSWSDYQAKLAAGEVDAIKPPEHV